ncbi:MAG TPA: SCO family protein, partial [Burkholderiales bacterium]|nr:SCO family protein [Burkholderiales bacterium]
MRSFSRLFWSIITCSLALVAGCESSPQFKSTDITGAPYGRTLELVDHTGKARRLEDWRGKAVVLFFGFT